MILSIVQSLAFVGGATVVTESFAEVRDQLLVWFDESEFTQFGAGFDENGTPVSAVGTAIDDSAERQRRVFQ